MKKISLLILLFLFNSTFGQTWMKMNLPNDNWWYSSVKILNNGIIGLVGGSGVCISTDKGETWIHSLVSPNVLNFEATATSFYALGGYGGAFIYTSDNEGLTWDNLSGNITTSGYVTDVAVLNHDQLYAYGSQFGGDSPQIYFTSDRGTSWTSKSDSPLPSMYEIICTQNNILYGLHFDWGFYRSLDGGKSWTININGITSNKFNSLVQTEEGELLISANHGKLFKSTDMGSSWFSLTNDFSDDKFLKHLNISYSGNYYIVAEDSLTASVNVSSDNGSTWSQIGETIQLERPYEFTFKGMVITPEESIILLEDNDLFTNDINYVTSISEGKNWIDKEFMLKQNYPNPFNPTTKIIFQIPTNKNAVISNVKLIIYDALGNEISTLVNEQKQSGRYEVEFDGAGLTSGIYFYKLNVGNYSETRKMLFIK